MSQREAYQVQFNNYLIELIKKLQTLFPENKRLFTKYYKYYRGFVEQNKRSEFVGEFIQYLSRYNREVSTSDQGLFSEEDDYYPGKPIQLLKGIDFKLLWKQTGLTDGSKESLWKYLQTLYLLGTFVLKEDEKYAGLLHQQREIIGGLIQNMKYEQKIKDDAQKLIKEEEDKDKADSMFGLGELFDGDNVITQIIKEISSEIKFTPEDGQDPIQAIKMLFGQDNNRLEEIISRVTHRLSSIIKEKGLTEQELMEQAKHMQDKLMKKFKGIPGMPNLDQLCQKIAEQCAAKMPDTDASTSTSTSVPPPTTPLSLDHCEEKIHELTAMLKGNFSQLGLDNIEDLQHNMEGMVTQLMAGSDHLSQTVPPPKH